MSNTQQRLYSGLSAVERAEARRSRLLEAAHILIGRDGFAATSIEHICSTAKVSTRDFYQHYDRKEAILLDLFGQITTRSLVGAVDMLAATAGQSARERVTTAIRAYVYPMVEDPHAARITIVEVLGAPARIESRRLKVRDAIVDLIVSECTAAVERGDLRDRDFRFAALALMGSTNAIIYDWIRGPDRPVEQLVEQLADLAVTILAD